MKQYGMALFFVLSIIFLMNSLVYISHNYLFDVKYFSEIYRRKHESKWPLLAVENIFLKSAVKDLSTKYYYNRLLRLFNSSDVMKLNDKDYRIKMVDDTNCFNTNSLPLSLTGNKTLIESYHWQVFNKLLLASGVSEKKTKDIITFIIEHVSLIKESNDFSLETSELSKGNIIYYLSSHNDDIYSKVVPMLCHRKDDELLININSLDIRHVKFVRAMLLNIISEKDIENLILSRPDDGWKSNLSLYNFIHNSSSISKDDMKILQNIIISVFLSDRYYSRLLLWADDYGHYQLVSDLLITRDDITVLSRSYMRKGLYP